MVSGGAEDQVEYLRRELEIRNDELRRKDHQLAAAPERIPAIEPPETPEAPKGASEKPTGPAQTTGATGANLAPTGAELVAAILWLRVEGSRRREGLAQS